MKTKQFLSFLLLLFFFVSFAQQSVNASGGKASNANNSVSYSIGQSFYRQTNGGGIVLIEGVQQPFEITTLGTNEYPGVQLGIKAYPNPTTSLLFLKIENLPLQDLHYQLFDSSGRMVSKDKIQQMETSIDMASRPSGVYILNVLRSNRSIKSFKILKN